MSFEKKFYGHGKLLITGEYFVLDGAKALALPTKFGQHLRVRELDSADGILFWAALNSKGQPWLQFSFDKEGLYCLNNSEVEAKDLSIILNEARALNPEFLTGKKNVAVETKLEFPNNWGLGSSSTLIYCIAQWANVDAHQLLQNSIGGSGYDVACAGSDSAILYQLQNTKPVMKKMNWLPEFRSQIYFAHLGKKQSSPDGIKYYRQQLKDKSLGVSAISGITEKILQAKNLCEFEALIDEHEKIVSSQINLVTVKENLFSDYWGSVKSLGAWGGDFVLLTNNRSKEELTEFLHQKNITTVFSWVEMIPPLTSP